MKAILLLLITFVTQGSCQTNQSQAILSVEYTMVSRGFYQQIIIDKNTLIKRQKKGSTGEYFNCTDTDWQQIISAIKSIELDDFETINPPSQAFQHDGAAMAQLKLVTSDKTYQTSSFDHGNPPQDIKKLVEVILSVAQNIE
ncbi:hypothetical protein KFZ70_06425 [Tamlana fucoidanivorans]|uniref:Uncharacterized protein n=1 Tax=Allotamlana fucoidanivorans TaxID=2583814 RepID=A0A5C4SPE8_9FLAO|nr:hypothetical protein [Tamlana fucoidanivorans]TNJ45352.1 hypothetical protein FGF67_06480 [Tamlana fucoidanivorans]